MNKIIEKLVTKTNYKRILLTKGKFSILFGNKEKFAYLKNKVKAKTKRKFSKLTE